MADADTIGPMEAPWNVPDPLTSVHQLKSLVDLGFSVGHDSTSDLQTPIHSAMGGIRKEVDQHLDYLETGPLRIQLLKKTNTHQYFNIDPLED